MKCNVSDLLNSGVLTRRTITLHVNMGAPIEKIEANNPAGFKYEIDLDQYITWLENRYVNAPSSQLHAMGRLLHDLYRYRLNEMRKDRLIRERYGLQQ